MFRTSVSSSARRKLCIRNVASDQQKELKEPVNGEGKLHETDLRFYPTIVSVVDVNVNVFDNGVDFSNYREFVFI